MSVEVGRPATEAERPCVAIVTDHYNLNHAYRYDDQLHDLDFQTEWVIDSAILESWEKLSSAVATSPDNPTLVRHPFTYSGQYRTSMTDTLKNPKLQAERLEILRDSDIVLGVNFASSERTKNFLNSFTRDYLAMGIALEKLVVVSDSFPTVARYQDRGTYVHSHLSQKGLELHALGVRRAQGDMNEVTTLYKTHTEATAEARAV